MRAAVLLLALLATAAATWTRNARVSPTQDHTVGFALKPIAGSQERGDVIASELHDPNHPRYQRWLSLKEIEGLFVNTTSVELVHSHLVAEGYQVEVRGDFLWATAPVSTIEAHMSAELYHYSHVAGHTALKTDDFVMPEEIAAHVSIVLNFNHLPPVRRVQKKVKSALFAGKGYVDLGTLQNIYQVPQGIIRSPSTTQMIIGQGVLDSDLKQFFQQYNSVLKTASSLPLTRMGPDDTTYCKTNDCGEPTLDMAYSMGMAPGVQTILFNYHGDGLGAMYNYIATNAKPPQVTSASLGTGPNKDYDIRVCQEIQKATLRGVTSFAASGDGGAFSGQNANNGYPTNCPYITAVGGTQGPENGNPESTWDHSGVSVATGIFPVPFWQKKPIADYLKKAKGLPSMSRFNTSSGRITPDVAGVASILPLYSRGKLVFAAGTSFASPIWAGVTSNLVAARNGKGYGAIHITIAALAANGRNPLRDITTGSVKNNGLGDFPATQGWDIGTGYGSPIYNALRNL